MKLIQKTPLYFRRDLTPPEPGVIFVLDKDFVVGPYTVPAGFGTDLASVPLGFRNLASKVDGIEAATVHDYLYRTGKVPRAEADEVFFDLLEGQVPGWKRYAMWGAVRAFGWLSYKG